MFPVITKMKKSAKNFYYHPKGLFQHCFQTYEALENIFIKLDKYFPNSKDILEKHLNEPFSENVNKKNLLKFIAIFHDCAKPECAKRMDNKMRFLGHEELGAKKTAQIMKELKMSNKEIDFAKAIISEHMRPSNLAKSEVITNRAQMRLFRDIKENTPDLLIMAMSDWHSYKTLKKKVYPKKVLQQQEKSVAKLIFAYFDFINKKPKDKIVDGNVLMKEFHLKPGKIIGELLKYINNAYEEGRIKDKKQALKYAKSQLTVLKKKHKII
jgi:tRNA nucleotidyltransferase/poly(A) polymerase